jgi:hypothetical protein
MITNGLVKNRSVITHSNHSSQSPPLHEAFATLPGNVSFRRIRRYGIFHSLATSPNTNLSLSPVFFGFGRIWGSSPRKGRYVQLDGRGTVHSDEEEWTRNEWNTWEPCFRRCHSAQPMITLLFWYRALSFLAPITLKSLRQIWLCDGDEVCRLSFN